MTIQDDETLQMYLEESLEHLADIENDILAIEADGADINEDLVNKVYRAAHSIKGGAGFMGLTNIKDLTHEMENILGKIRSREMIPDSGIANALLTAADALTFDFGVGSKTMKERSSRFPPSSRRRCCPRRAIPFLLSPFSAHDTKGSLER